MYFHLEFTADFSHFPVKYDFDFGCAEVAILVNNYLRWVNEG